MKSQEDKSRILIIGYGNTLRGDDGLGCAVAQMLTRSDLRIALRHQLTPDLAETISQYDLVIFIDANSNIPPGRIDRQTIHPHATNQAGLNHHLGPEQLLAVAETLYGHVPQAYTFSIGGEFWGFSQSLSPKVHAAIPELLRQIEQLLPAGAGT